MANPDRQRAHRAFKMARFWLLSSIGFSFATWIYPPRPYILPSTIMAIGAGITMVFCLVLAGLLWRRSR